MHSFLAESQDKKLLFLATLLFLLVRVLLLEQYRENNPFFSYPIIDSEMYLRWAEAILDGKTFFTHEYHHPPGYAVFLAAILGLSNHNLYAVVAFQFLLLAIQGWVLFFLAKRLFGRRPAWIAFLLYSICGPVLFYSMKILSETLYTTLLLASFFFLIRYAQQTKIADIFLCGLLLGLAMEVRGNAMVCIIPSLAVVLFAQHEFARRAKATLLLLLGVAVFTVPVLIRNVTVAGAWTPVASNWGENFYFGNNPDSTGGVPAIKGIRRNILDQIPDVTKEAGKRAGRPLTSLEAQRFWSREGFRFILNHPIDWLRLEWIKLRRTLQADLPSGNYSYSLESKHYQPHFRKFTIGYGWLFPLFFAGLFFLPAGQNTRIFLFYFAVQASFMLLFWPEERYLLPIVPYLLLSAGCLVLFRAAPKFSVLKIGVGVTGLLLCLFANWKPIPVGGAEAWYTNASAAHFANGQFAQSAQMASQALQINPRYVEAWTNLGAALHSLRRTSEARNAWLRALEIDSTNLVALRNLAISYEKEDASLSLTWWDRTLKAAIAGEAPAETISAIKTRIGELQSF